MTPAPGGVQTKPMLKANVDVFRHVVRGEVSYLLHDRALDRQYWMTAAGAALIGSLDGKRQIRETIEDLDARDGAAALDASDTARFFNQLGSLGLLRTGHPPSVDEIERKRADQARRGFVAFIKSPLFLRIPLLDPTPILARLDGIRPYLFGSWGLAVWLVVTAVGALLGAMHWHELTQDLTDRLLSMENLAVAWAVYPAIKIAHEFMHALALRHFGGEVRRMGIIVVALVPVPYVDASSSVTFTNKNWRMLVAGAGVLTELFLCAVAIVVWTVSEPSLIRTVCYNVILITGVSTLLFNDGYYILTDLIGIPGLGTRSAQKMSYLAKRWLLADANARPPRATPGENVWFSLYGPASFIYRTGLMISIAVYVQASYPAIGVALIVWTAIGMTIGPATAVAAALRSPRPGARWRSLRRLALIALTLGGLLFLLPAPFGAVVYGTVWLPDEANARARTAGQIAAIPVKPGQQVAEGEPLVQLVNADIDKRVVVAEARLREMEASYTQAFTIGRVQAAIQADKVQQARDELEQAETVRHGLVVRSPAAGKLLFQEFDNLPGRYLAKGEAVAVIWNADAAIVRALVPLWQIDLVRDRTRSVTIKPAYDPGLNFPGAIIRIAPSASDQLPNQILSIEGGGPFAATRDRDNGYRMQEAMFQVDIRIEKPLPVDFLNGVAHVRFDLGWEPIGFQLFRKIRLAFLRHFHA
jgi:putative peptide zinc metalloprotease protein